MKWFTVIHVGRRKILRPPSAAGPGPCVVVKKMIRLTLGRDTVVQLDQAWRGNQMGWMILYRNERWWFAKRWQAMEVLRHLDAERRLGGVW